jgi:hypothetical protein
LSTKKYPTFSGLKQKQQQAMMDDGGWGPDTSDF